MSDRTSEELKSSSSLSVKAAKGAKKLTQRAVQLTQKGLKAFSFISGPAAKGILCGIIALVLVMTVLSEGMPATSSNSFTHVNENQDAISEAASGNSDYDNLDSARRAEGEGINILGGLLKEEKVEMEQKLKEMCTEKGVNYDATLQMLDANFVELGSASFNQHAEGTYSQEEYDACVLLSAYSVSVDNLWGQSEDTTGDIFGGYDASSISLKDEEGRAKYIYVKLRGEGYSHNAACGILGNLSQETGGINSKSVNSIGASGIVQWYRGRCKNMKAYAQKKGKPWTDFKTQVDYMIYEIKHSYKNSVYDKIHKGGVSLIKATDIVLRYYENPGNYDVELHQNRLPKAKKWSAKFKNLNMSGFSATNAQNGSEAVRMAAVEWGKKIGDDDSFHYGRKSKGAQTLGCYFCGTNKPGKCKKRMGREEMLKTWACCEFVTACYVHGGKVKDMSCMHRWIGTGGNKNWGAGQYLAKSKYWKKVNPKYSELQIGDVVIYKGHTTIYAGDGKCIQSHGGDDGKRGSKKWKKSIGLWKFDKKRFNNKKHTVWRYVGGYEGSNLSRAAASAAMDGVSEGTQTSRPAENAKVYKKYKKIADIGSGDVTNWHTVAAQDGYYISQSMAWLGNGEYVVSMCNGGAKNKSMLVKYDGKTFKNKQQSDSARHGNGICYNAQEGKLYSARATSGGGNRHILTVFDAQTLKPAGTKKIKNVASCIGYDSCTGRYAINGHTIHILDRNFKKIKNAKKKKQRGPQDCNCFNSVVFCVGAPRAGCPIDMYRMTDGAYLGTITTSLGEVESVCIDDDGYMLLLNAYRTIYKTKKKISEYIDIPNTLQAAATGTGADLERDYNENVISGEGIAKSKANSSEDHKHNIDASKYGAVKMKENWRVDLSEKFKKYLEGNDYYSIKLDEDEKGNAIIYEGTVDKNANEKEKTEKLKEEKDEDIVDDGSERSVLEKLTETEKGDAYKDYMNSSLPGSDTAKENNEKRVNQKKAPKLKKATYIKADLIKTDVAEAALSAFNVKKKDITEHYGKNVTRKEALDQMAKSSLAMLHDIDDFNADLYTENLDATYKVSKKAIGKYKITAYCNCKEEPACRKNNLKLFGREELSPNTKRTAGVTCAAPRDIPIGTILFIKKLGRMVVVDEHLKFTAPDQIAIYTGKKHNNWTARSKEFKKAGELGVYLVTGITSGQAKSMGYGVTGIVKGKRTKYPDLNNQFYFSGKYNIYTETAYGPPSIYHNCTWYAFGRFSEILGKKSELPMGDAGQWYGKCTAYKKGKTPKPGAVICFSYPGGGAGHVAVVEEVKSNGDIITSNSAYNHGRDPKKHIFYMRTIKKSDGYNAPGMHFQGFIYQPGT